ncbi:MAG TPA: hypothetical protein VNJ04_03560 [Gemmatimonadaceae bacterium]|nr:hypothetical protein [Gemmatimonadaceae bacterium]
MMDLDQALAKVDRDMDGLADRILCEAEDFIRDLGATDDECHAWLDRKRQELSETRRQVHDIVIVAYWTDRASSFRVN